ncbi:MAG: hypothetical protein R2705_02380 [Ilumatobacteraceae bacterium]
MTTRSAAATAEPDILDVKHSLERVLGEEFDAIWADICTSCALGGDEQHLDDGPLDKLLDTLISKGAICRVVAMSWKIRRTAAHKLAALGR